MQTKNIANAKIKREFISYMKNVEGVSENTVDSYLRPICIYEDITNNADFKKFNKRTAIKFKENLKAMVFNRKPISSLTRRTYQFHLFKFLKWLSFQPGYKIHININEVNYLKPNHNEEKLARYSRAKDAPDLGYILQLHDSIVRNNEVDFRDKALISFLFEAPLRVDSAISLSLGCIDDENFVVHQDPHAKVRTKFGKYIVTPIFQFDDQLTETIRQWLKHLKEKGFKETDPVFPHSKYIFKKDIIAYDKPTEVLKDFMIGTDSIREILKRRTKVAGLRYLSPHRYRDGFIKHALLFAKDGLQFKSISQALGHEHFSTSMIHYGNLNEKELIDIVKGIDFRNKPISNSELLKKMYILFQKNGLEN